MRATASAPSLTASNGSRPVTAPLDANIGESPDRGSTPRLKGSNIVLTPESPVANAFKTYPDFSKLNSETVNALRSDTFGTPSSLNTKYHTPSRLEKKKAMEDPAEFQRRMLKAVHDMQLAHKEQQESMETLRRDMANALDEQTSARGILEKIQELTGVLEEKSRQPLDLSKVLEELQAVRKISSECQNQMECRISEQIKQVVQEMQTVRQQQEQAESGHLVQIHEEILKVRLVPEVKDVVHRSEVQLGDMLKLTQSMSADSTRTSKDIQEIHDHHARTFQDVAMLLKESKEHYTNFVPCLQTQLTTYLRRNPVNVDFREVLSVQSKTHDSMQLGFEQLLGEIARVQQALNVDFARVIDDVADSMRKSIADIKVPQYGQEVKAVEASRRSIAGKHLMFAPPPPPVAIPEKKTHRQQSMGGDGPTKARKRFRHYWAQTESTPTADVWVQTDDEMWKSALKPKKKGKMGKKPQPEKLGNHRPTTGRKAFQDAEKIKNQMRGQLMQPEYNVRDFYQETGCCQAIARNPLFENLTLFVTLANVVWIGVDTDLNDNVVLIDADPMFQVAENLFCTYFTTELLIRFLAFKEKRNCLKDFWFLFDTVLVIVMIAETWILSIVMLSLEDRPSEDFGGLSILRVFRFVKVVRVSRLAKLLRAIPEIVVLLKGITIAVRTVTVFFILWLVIIFVFAIIFRQVTNDEEIGRRYFNSVPTAMNTLLLNGLLPENEPLVNEVTGSNPLCWLLMMAFIAMASLTLMHMLVGVLVETICIISMVEKESMAVKYVSSELRNIYQALDHDPEGTLTKTQFQKFIMEPGVARLFRTEGVDTNVLIDMAEIIFQDLETTGSGGLSFEMLCEIVLNMRGSNPATVKDVKEQLRLIKSVMRESVSYMLNVLHHDMDQMKEELTAVVIDHAPADHHSEVDDSGDESHTLYEDDMHLQELDAVTE